jgi:hypothetical protein
MIMKCRLFTTSSRQTAERLMELGCHTGKSCDQRQMTAFQVMNGLRERPLRRCAGYPVDA